MSERVNKIVEIDKYAASELLKPLGTNYKIKSIERFTEGKSTSNYRIKLEGLNTDLVLRIYPQESGICEKEHSIYNKVRSFLPVPKIYYYNTDKRIIDNPYSVIEYLDGITLDKYIEKHNSFPEVLAEKIGEKLALLHKNEYETEGLLDSNLSLTDGLPPILTWYDYFLNDVAGQRLDAAVKDTISSFIKNNHDLLLEMTQTPVFSHGDFRPENIMIKADKLVGILDWEFSMSAPCYFDIGQFIRISEFIPENAENSFIKGYNRNAKHPVTGHWKKLAKLMDMTNMLSFLNAREERPVLYSNMKKLIDKSLSLLMEK
jgi:aminoglycoside phosphotransferase (APT) family kinase protein